MYKILAFILTMCVWIGTSCIMTVDERPHRYRGRYCTYFYHEYYYEYCCAYTARDYYRGHFDYCMKYLY